MKVLDEQNSENSKFVMDKISSVGCVKISGSVLERHGLEEVKNFLREGYVLVVWRFDIVWHF
jgi:DNA invertase Pin-like site-specific DNA recombinase